MHVDPLTQQERTYCEANFKRLEQGTFQRPLCPADADHVVMDTTDLTLLLSGIELTSVKRRRRYSFDSAPPAPREPSGS